MTPFRVHYVPSMDFYKLDFIARMLMVLNSSVNFVVYCSVSTPFKVKARVRYSRKIKVEYEYGFRSIRISISFHCPMQRTFYGLVSPVLPSRLRSCLCRRQRRGDGGDEGGGEKGASDQTISRFFCCARARVHC